MSNSAQRQHGLPLLVVIAGPTAVGKTQRTTQLAQEMNAEVLYADSRQIYSELSIGVAKPKPEELGGVPHHLIGHVPIQQPYTSADFERDAISKLENLFTKEGNKVAILSGGTGLYIDAVLSGFDELPKVKPGLREEIQSELEGKGLGWLQEEVRRQDPKYFAKVDIQNPRRLQRALEVIRSTGKPFSLFQTGEAKERPFRTLLLVLNRDRQELHQRINQRVVQMLDEGQLQEAESLHGYKELNALQTVGYTEVFDYLEGKHSMERAIELIQRNTRRFAKRQLTYFRKWKDAHWVHPEEVEKMRGLIHSML